MEEEPLLLSCETCGNGFVVSIDPGSFVCTLAEQKG